MVRLGAYAVFLVPTFSIENHSHTNKVQQYSQQ